jgi:hypothetical protein
MSTTTYLIKKNTDFPATLESLGLVRADPTYRANGLDTLTMQTVDDFDGSALFSFGDTVALIRRVVDGSTTTDTCEFVGTVRAIPRAADDQGHSTTYTAENAVKTLKRCTYAQEWKVYSGGATTITEPRVILGENNAGTRRKNGEMISDILTYAAAAGVSLQVGSCAAGTYTPYDERENITCWDAIVSMLRYTPDYVLAVDYSTMNAAETLYVPTFSLVAPSSMSTVSKAVRNADITGSGITPRDDTKIPGISIMFRYTGSVDGQTVKYRTTQTAGNTSHPECVRLVYDLEGPQITYVKQTVEVENYPDGLSNWQSATGKAFIAARVPELNISGVTFSVNSVSSSGSKNLPACLKSGTLIPWMGKDQEFEIFTVDIDFTISSGGSVIDKGTKEVFFKETSTDATSKEYKKQENYVGPEAVPSDMATNLYTSWNRLHFDGEATLTLDAHTFDLRPGVRLNLTGGAASWATMAAIIQDAAYDLQAGTVTVSFGTCGRLEADNLLAVYRAARGRKYAYSRTSRDTEESIDNSVEGSTATPNGNAAGGAATARERFRVEGKDDTGNAVVMDFYPDGISYNDATDKGNRAIQLREFYALFWDATNEVLKAQLVQGFISDAYGDQEDVGGGESVEVEKSIKINADGKLQLVGDDAAPGNNYAYCTDEDGDKGWLPGVIING